MALREPDSSLGPFRERNTCVLTATVKDNLGVVIPGADLDTMTLTLYLEKSPYPIVNSRDHVDLLSYVDSSGNLEFELTSDDMAMIGTGLEEYHRALLEWEWTAVTPKYGSYEIQIQISNVQKVP